MLVPQAELVSAAQLIMTLIPLPAIDTEEGTKHGVLDTKAGTHVLDICITHNAWLRKCALFGEFSHLVAVRL